MTAVIKALLLSTKKNKHLDNLIEIEHENERQLFNEDVKEEIIDEETIPEDDSISTEEEKKEEEKKEEEGEDSDSLDFIYQFPIISATCNPSFETDTFKQILGEKQTEDIKLSDLPNIIYKRTIKKSRLDSTKSSSNKSKKSNMYLEEGEEMNAIIRKVMEENKDKIDSKGNYIVDFKLFGITYNGIGKNGVPFRKIKYCGPYNYYKHTPYLTKAYKIIIKKFKENLKEAGFPEFSPKSKYDKPNGELTEKYDRMYTQLIISLYKIYMIGHILDFYHLEPYFIYYISQNESRREDIINLFIKSYKDSEKECTELKEAYDKRLKEEFSD